MDYNRDKLINDICSDEMLTFPSSGRRVINFLLAWPNLIDLAATLPSYISWGMSYFEGGESGSSGAIFRLIRLARIIRAFRLGRRFEAAIIIVRALRRSLRALCVLVLNLCLFLIIFGAIMYFIEQGTWDQ